MDIDLFAKEAVVRSTSFLNNMQARSEIATKANPLIMNLRLASEYIASEKSRALDVGNAVAKSYIDAVNKHFGSDVDVPFFVDTEPMIQSLAIYAGNDVKRFIATTRTNGLITSRFTDKAGKSWRGEVFVRTVWRKFLVDVRADATVAALLANDQKFAVLSNPGNEQANGLKFSITNDFRYKTWPEVKDEFFHPNSRSIVKPVGDGHVSISR